MGRERRGKGRYIRLCLAGLITLTVTACIPVVRQTETDGTGRGFPHLADLRPFVAAGDFEGALQAGQDALEDGGSRADAALFDLALLSVHYGNPKKDYRRALLLFGRLARDHPGSPLAEEAKVWIGVLESIERSRRIDIEIEERKKEVSK